MDNNRIDSPARTIGAVLVVIFIIALAFLCCLVSSCSVQKPQIIVRDSVRVEYRDRIVRDTVGYEIPVEVEKIVTRDTASHLSNRLAESDAVVSGGFLFHSLRTKAQTIYVPVEVHVTDTLVVEKEAQEIEKTEYVEKQLNWWQKFRLNGFWVLLVVALVGWRREIWKLIKLLF